MVLSWNNKSYKLYDQLKDKQSPRRQEAMSDRPSTCIYRDASTQEIYMHVYTDAWHVEPYTRTSKQLTTHEQLVLIMSSKFILKHLRQADTTSSTWSSSTLPQARRFTDDGIDDHMIYDSKTASTKSSCDICKAQSPSDMCKTYSSSDICKKLAMA